VAGLISPATISALIRTYVWGWAIEWVFFIVEIVAALVYFATWDRISKRAHLLVIWIYFVAAYASLVVINGIITFMLTPGDWLQTHSFWDGFFNPTYWPSLLLRSGIAILIAAAFMLFPAWRGSALARPRLARYLGWWLAAGVFVAYAGYRWWEAALPESIQSMFLGAAPVLGALADTRQFLLWSITAVLVLGAVFLLAAPRWARPVTAVLVMLAAFAFFGGYERLREGVRKPFLIHDYMFSNGLRVDQIESINENGMLGTSRWAALVPEDDEIERGRQIFRTQCASCHTLDGYQGIRELLPDDPDMAMGVLFVMYEQGGAYASAQPAEPVNKTELDYPFMPPFVGTEDEMADLASYLAGLATDDNAVTGEGGR
jgi:mono/diheme cytochrome c family protein